MTQAFRRTITVWIAIWAMLLLAFSPAIVHGPMYAQAQSQGNWEDVCTSLGSARVKLGDGAQTSKLRSDSQSNGPIDVTHLAKCQICLTHAGTNGLPPVDSEDGLKAVQSPGFVLTHNDPNLLYTVWSIPSARAPPSI